MAIWSTVLNFIPSIFKGAVEVHKTNKAVKTAQQERIHELQVAAINAEIEQIKLGNAANRDMDAKAEDRIPWANDVTLILVLIPAVLAFYPPAVPAVMTGFEVLGKMPELYQYTLGGMLISVWGYRAILVPIIKARLGVK